MASHLRRALLSLSHVAVLPRQLPHHRGIRLELGWSPLNALGTPHGDDAKPVPSAFSFSMALIESSWPTSWASLPLPFNACGVVPPELADLHSCASEPHTLQSSGFPARNRKLPHLPSPTKILSRGQTIHPKVAHVSWNCTRNSGSFRISRLCLLANSSRWVLNMPNCFDIWPSWASAETVPRSLYLASASLSLAMAPAPTLRQCNPILGEPAACCRDPGSPRYYRIFWLRAF